DVCSSDLRHSCRAFARTPWAPTPSRKPVPEAMPSRYPRAQRHAMEALFSQEENYGSRTRRRQDCLFCLLTPIRIADTRGSLLFSWSVILPVLQWERRRTSWESAPAPLASWFWRSVLSLPVASWARLARDIKLLLRP